MQLAYELLPVWAGQDENLPTAIPKLRHRSRVYLLHKMHAGGHDLQSCRESLAKLQPHGSKPCPPTHEQFHEPGFEDVAALRAQPQPVEARPLQNTR